jgi:hypothetical protein
MIKLYTRLYIGRKRIPVGHKFFVFKPLDIDRVCILNAHGRIATISLGLGEVTIAY